MRTGLRMIWSGPNSCGSSCWLCSWAGSCSALLPKSYKSGQIAFAGETYIWSSLFPFLQSSSSSSCASRGPYKDIPHLAFDMSSAVKPQEPLSCNTDSELKSLACMSYIDSYLTFCNIASLELIWSIRQALAYDSMSPTLKHCKHQFSCSLLCDKQVWWSDC